MAVLSEETRVQVWAEWMKDNSEAVNISKADIRTAVNEIDNWVESQLAGALTCMSEPALSGLTADQKFNLFNRIVRKRVE